MVDEIEDFKNGVYAELDSMSDIDVARAIACAKSQESQFIILDYVSNRPNRKEKIREILNEDSKSLGLLLEEDF